MWNCEVGVSRARKALSSPSSDSISAPAVTEAAGAPFGRRQVVESDRLEGGVFHPLR